MDFLLKVVMAVLILGAVDVSGWLFNKEPPPPPPTCNVGELYGRMQGDGRCTNSTCWERCRSMYGEDSQGGYCSPPRGNGRTECYCRLTCVTAGCTGDPHCTSFDGVKNWGYQGLEKHYLLRPMGGRDFNFFPKFEVRQTNAETGRDNGVSTVGSIELLVPEWEQRLELRSAGLFRVGLLVNGQPMDIPYRYTDIDENDYREEFIDVQYAPNSLNRAIIETSFGVRIVFWPGDGWVSIPRHSDLKDKTEGLLGRWNDNPDDDFVDSRGVNRARDLFSWDFGDSWCLQNCAKSRQEYERWMQMQQSRVAMFRKDSVRSGRIESFCRKLQDNAFHECAKRMGRTILSTEQCYNDLAFATRDTDQEDIVCTTLRNYNHMCNLGYSDSQCEGSNRREKTATRPPTVRPPGAASVYRPPKHFPRRNGGSGGGERRGENGMGHREHGHNSSNGVGNGGRFNGTRPGGGSGREHDRNQVGGSTGRPWTGRSRQPNGNFGSTGRPWTSGSRQENRGSSTGRPWTEGSRQPNGQSNGNFDRASTQSSQSGGGRFSTVQPSQSHGHSTGSGFGQSNNNGQWNHNGQSNTGTENDKETHNRGDGNRGNGNNHPTPNPGQHSGDHAENGHAKSTDSNDQSPFGQKPPKSHSSKPKSAEQRPNEEEHHSHHRPSRPADHLNPDMSNSGRSESPDQAPARNHPRQRPQERPIEAPAPPKSPPAEKPSPAEKEKEHRHHG